MTHAPATLAQDARNAPGVVSECGACDVSAVSQVATLSLVTWPPALEPLSLTAPEPVACMTPDERHLWELANAQVRSPAPRPCADCPAAWARRLRAEGRCNGMPGASVAA